VSGDSLWMIGCGNMAGAMLSRWLVTGIDPARVTVIDPAGPMLPVTVLAQLPDASPPDMLMLGVKPQMLADVAGGLQAASAGALVLSILAGTTTGTLRTLFPRARGIVRIMPNLPVALGKGAVALFADATAEDRATVATLVAPLGLVEWIADEALFDAVTALSGSGPAFVYRFIDALAQGGAALGLPAAQAMRLAKATVEGAAAVVAASSVSTVELAEKVASKGGSTRAALDVLDDAANLESLVAKALAAAQARNAELAALTRPG
jgi:pyrroline-5-carboxylate reductase